MAEWMKRTPETITALQAGHRLVVDFPFGPDVVGADDWTDLCDAIIPGYAEIDPSDTTAQLQARILHAVTVQVAYQAVICEAVDLSGCSAAELEVLTAERTHQPDITVWTSPVPLVLVDRFEYQPDGPKTRPVGLLPGTEPDSNLVWLDPADEASLPHSMEQARLIDILQDTDTAIAH